MASGSVDLGSTVSSGGGSADAITSLTGDVSATGPGAAAATISAATVTGKALTGFVSSAGTVSSSDTILTAIDKLDGNIAAKVTGPASSMKYATPLYADTTGKLLVAPTIMQNWTASDHFVLGTAAGNGDFLNFNNGTGSGVGAITNNAVLNGHPGINFLRTGTDTSGYAFFYQGSNTIAFGSGVYYIYETMIYAPVAVPDGTDDYYIYAGFNDILTGAATDGAYIAFNRDLGVSATNFLAVTANNGTRTTQDTGIAFAATTWYKLTVVHDGTQAYFYINDVLTNTISTNLPSGGARATSFCLALNKAAGTTSRDLYVDYCYQQQYTP